MKKTIYKYQLETTGYQKLDMPMGAEILTVQTQNGTPCIWALVNPESKGEIRHIEIFGTGHEIPCGTDIERKYIGTYQLANGSFIGHVFERIK